jgi:hypothetical protein
LGKNVKFGEGGPVGEVSGPDGEGVKSDGRRRGG